jgi:hypothetical protein
VTFEEVAKPLLGKQREIEVAKTPDQWFSYLKARDAGGIRLVRQAKMNHAKG